MFPLFLTKDQVWIVSNKKFLILSSGERVELSHWTYSQIKNLYASWKSGPGVSESEKSPLTLEELFSDLPNRNFLFSLGGSDHEKIIKSLETSFKGKTRGEMFLTSLEEKLLMAISSSHWRILQSFKAFVRWQILSSFQLNPLMNFIGEGVIIPSSFSLSSKTLLKLKKQKKLIFLEKDPPYDSSDSLLIQRAQALISSEPELALSTIPGKKTCFINK